MSWFVDLLLLKFGSLVYSQAIKRIRQKSLLIYMKALQVVRRSMLVAVAIFFFLQLMLIGFIGAIVTGVLLTPADSTTKLWILFSVFTVLFVIPGFLLLILMSDRMWFEISGARELLQKEEF